MENLKLIDEKMLMDKIRDLFSSQRKDISRGFVSTKEAMYILGVGKDKFYELQGDPNTKIRASKLKGKYLLKSINQEVERLTK